MLDFMRNKLISVFRRDAETLTVHAVLDDSIYSLEIDLAIRTTDLKCLSIEGRWKRWTTPECPKSIPFLQQAKEFYLTPGVDNQIHKVIGRTSCRHYANLLIDCAYAVQETVKQISGQKDLTRADTAPETEPKAKDISTGPSKVSSPSPAKKVHTPGESFFIDLHLHTFPASKCASSQVGDMIEEAKHIGLDAVCLTDHNYVWSRDEVNRLMDIHQFMIFRGNEIVTDQGDMLVFGMDQDVRGVIPLARLKDMVDKTGGFIAAAHPFRGFLTFGADQLGLTPEKAMERDMFKLVHAMETLNGKVTEQENRLSSQVAQRLGLPATGGSDAHDISTVGVYATRFNEAFSTEEELVKALLAGKCEPVEFRRLVKADAD